MFRPCKSACIVLTETPISRANALDALPCPDSHLASFSMLADWHIQKTFASPKISIAIAFRICEKQSSSKGDTQMTRQEMQRLSIAELRKLAQDAAGHIIGERAEDVLREVTAPTRIKLHGRIGG
jgi:hypothetical protein